MSFLHDEIVNDTVCPEQQCHGYFAYRSLVPSEFRICNQCELEMELYTQYRPPFSYRTTNETDYPSISYGESLVYKHEPVINPMKRYNLFLFICSAASEGELRSTLRPVLRPFMKRYRMGYFFVLGSSDNLTISTDIEYESQFYGDLLQLNHNDSYHQLTLSVFGAIQYLATHFVNTTYFMKTDSDCILNFPRIMEVLQNTSNPYIGNCKWRSSYLTEPKIGRSRKRYVPFSLVQEDVSIPPYATGAGYLLRQDVIQPLAIAIRHLNFIAHNEDVNIGKAMDMLHYHCEGMEKWVARYGCVRKTRRRKSKKQKKRRRNKKKGMEEMGMVEMMEMEGELSLEMMNNNVTMVMMENCTDHAIIHKLPKENVMMYWNLFL